MSERVFRLHVLPAGNGDALIVEYGTTVRTRRILVDGGVANTAPAVQKFLGPSAALQLLVVTHIDNDHIAGVLNLIDSANPPQPKDLWYNGYRHLPGSDAEAMGPVQGERLTKLIEKHHYCWNGEFGGNAVAVSAPPRPITLDGELACTVLSPTLDQLKTLRQRSTWTQVVQQAGLDPDVEVPVEPPAPAPGVERMGPLNIDTLANARTTPDTAAANGSSIALLLEFAGRRCLLAGDAHPGVLIATIDEIVGAGNALEVDVFKLPHHGSKANVTAELVQRVPAHTYVFSTDGSGHQRHPDDTAVARVINDAPRSPLLAFNYRSRRNEDWDDADLKDSYGYRTQYPLSPKRGITIDILGQAAASSGRHPTGGNSP
jgi:beta-lactamase superfamily II metal-dependent hydrolase